jgi:hypothetical protein
LAEFTDLTIGQINVEHRPILIEALCARFGYRDFNVDGSPNTETKGQYAMRKVRRWMLNCTKQYQRQIIEADDIDIIP